MTITTTANAASLALSNPTATLAITGATLQLNGVGSDVSNFTAGTVTLNGGNITGSGPAGGMTLNNSAVIDVTAGTNNIYGNSNAFTFNNAGSVITTAGTLTLGSYAADIIANTGTIEANGGSAVVYFAPNSSSMNNTGGTVVATNGGVVNLGNGTTPWLGASAGLITASAAGTVNFLGTLTYAQLSAATINGSGGTLNLKGTVNLATGNTFQAPHSGSFVLDGGTIKNGIVDGSLNAFTFSNSGGTLDADTMNNGFTVPSNDSFTVQNNTTFTGTTTFGTGDTVTVSGATSGTGLTIASGGTWTGGFSIGEGGTVALTIANAGTLNHSAGNNTIFGNNYGLTFNNSGTIETTSGTLTIGDFSNDTLVNTGILEASGNTAILNIGSYSSTLNNSGGTVIATGSAVVNFGTGTTTAWLGASGGTIEADHGAIVNLYGAFTYSQLTNSVIDSGGANPGTINLDGILNLTGGNTLQAPHSGIYTLYGGTIENGIIDGTNAALTFSGGGGTLDNDTVNNSVAVPTNSSFTVADNTTFTGATTFGTGDTVTVSGATSGTGLTIASGGTWTGGFSIGEGGTVALTIANAGTLNHSAGNNTIFGNNYGLTFNNSGTIETTSGTLTIGDFSNDTLVNTGILEASGNTAILNIGSYSSTLNNSGGTVIATGSAVVNFGTGTTTAWLGASGGTIEADHGAIVNLYGAFTYSQLTNSVIDSGGANPGTINLDGILNLTGGNTLQAPHSGIYTLYGGTIENGIIDGTNAALTFSGGGGTLDNDTVNNSVAVPTNSSFTVADNTTFTGATTFGTGDTVTVSGATSGTGLTIASGGTWTGGFSIGEGGTVALTIANAGTLNHSAGNNTIFGNNYGLTFNNSGTIETTSGTLTIGDFSNDTLVNTGILEASGSTAILNLGSYASTFNNSGGSVIATGSGVVNFGTGTTAPWLGSSGGHITATGGGVVNLNGLFTETQLSASTVNASTGTVNLVGTLTNTGLTLNDPVSGLYTLAGGTINGGSVADGALMFGNGGGILDNVTMKGVVSTPTGTNYANFHSAGSTSFTGTATFNTISGYDTVYLDSAGQSLDIAFGAVWSGGFNVTGVGTGSILTNEGTINYAANSTMTGNGNGLTFTNAGSVNAAGTTVTLGNSASDTITNASGGVISANSGSTITVGYNLATWANLAGGTINANNMGTIILSGAYNDASFGGAFNANTGGVIDLAGTFTNTGTLAVPTTGVYTLDGATINGGSVADGALMFSNGGGILKNVTMNGVVSTPTGANYANFHSAGSTSFTGTTTFSTSSGYDTVYLDSAGQSLDIALGAVWRGGFNLTGVGTGSIITNEGTLNYSANSTMTGNGNGLTFNNTGSVNAASATVTLGNSSTDTITNASGGIISANTSSTIYVGYNASSWANLAGGTINANNTGTIVLGGAYNDASFAGTFNANSGGVIDLAGTFTNTGILAVPTTGVYTLDGATINGGTVADGALVFSNGGGILKNVTMAGALSTPTGANYANFHSVGSTSFTGTTTFSTSSGYDTVYLDSAGQSLDIALGAVWRGGFNVTGSGTGSILTNEGTFNYAANSSMTGNGNGLTFNNTGSVNAASATVTLGNSATDMITNESGGVISANTSSTIYVGYNASGWANLAGGTINANNTGTIVLGGAYNDASFAGTFNANSGGVIDLAGTFTNAGTLAVPTTGVYTLDGATINGGSVADGALMFSNGGGILKNVTMKGAVSTPTGANYANFHSAGSTNFTGTTTFSTSSGYDTVYLDSAGESLDIASGAVWMGGFNVTGTGTGSIITNEGTLNYSANSAMTGNGNGLTFNNTGAVNAAGATVTLGNSASDTITNGNGGVISANSSSTLYVGYNASSWANLAGGTINANNTGTIVLGGVYNDASFAGTFNANSGGVIELTGTFTNAGTLSAPTTGFYTLDGATINGGTVASGALTFSNGAGTLNNVTMSGSFNFPTGGNYGYLHIAGTTSFNGGTTTFNSSSGYDTVYLTGAGAALNIGSSDTWTGAFNVSAQTATQTLTNLGTISLAGSSSTFAGSNTGFTFTNGGSFINNGSTVTLGDYANDTFTDSAGGLVETIGGTLYAAYNGSSVTNLTSGTLTNGTWEAAGGGTLSFEGTSPITTNNATLIISGTSSSIRTKSGSGSSYQTLGQTLVTNNGSLEILGGQNFAATNAITNNGLIQLGGGTYSGGTLTSGSGSSLSGNGTFNPTSGVTVGSSVTISPGAASANNYVNTLAFNSLTLAPGGSISFDLVNASGARGTGYDSLTVAGTANVTATAGTPFTVSLESIAPGTGLPGLATFTSSGNYSWTLLTAGSVTNFNAADFTVNTSSFTNSLGTGSFNFTSDATDIFLNFTPVPEPSTWVLIGSGAAMFGYLSWRRRRALLRQA